MSGPLVGLVNDHGPRDHAEWAVLSVLAERLHGPMRTYDTTTAALAHDARMVPKTAQRAVARLVANGWVHRIPGRWKGHASTYRMRLEAFPADAVEEALRAISKGVTESPFEISTGGHRVPLSEPKGDSESAKGDTESQHTVPYKQPSSSSEPMLAGVLVGVAEGHDDDELIQTALEGLPLGRTAAIKRKVRAALADGWIATDLHQHLAGHLGPNVTMPSAVVTAALNALPDPPRQKVSVWDVSTWCGECDQHNRWLDADGDHPRKCPTCHPGLVSVTSRAGTG